jgi:hypothetical protein
MCKKLPKLVSQSTLNCKIFVGTVLFFLSVAVILAQTGEFTYQGKLSDGGAPANGNYDFQFELHNSLASTTPLATATRSGVLVTNGIFTVQLDFPTALFDGTDRFLKINVKPAGSPNPYTALAPYQPLTSAPYSYKSLNAATADFAITANNSLQLGGVAANQYVQTTDSRMSDARTPLPGSPNYVQNTNSLQASSNFNISGTGTANTFNAATQYNVGGNRVLSVPGDQNVFAGLNSGTANTTGFGNAFFGHFAGNVNTTGANNSFFGTDAGRNNTADGNSFFGRSAGFATTGGINNAFFGLDSGRFNISGSNNAFFGKESGFNNIADGNSFFGYRAGFGNTSGNSNAFFGNGAGQANVTGNFNSFFGNQAGNLNTGTSNSFFGTSAGISNVGGGNNAFFGTIAGQQNTTGNNNTFYGAAAGSTNTTGTNNTALGFFANVGSNNLNFATAIGSGATVSTSNTIALGRSDGSDAVLIPGNLSISGTLAANLPAGDADYVQNRTTPQASTSFNISGSGTASVFNATAQYNINNNRVLSIAGTNNLFSGAGSGASNSGSGNTFIGSGAGSSNTSGNNNTFIGSGAGSSGVTGSNNVVIGSNANLSAGVSNSIVIGNGQSATTSNTLEIGASTVNISGTNISLSGNVDVLTFKVNSLGASGSTAICTNASGFFSTCSSSRRYKTNIRTYGGGLEILRYFRPVTFDWKADGKPDVGFVAEEVNELEPLLATYNDKGEVEGVKYAQITTVLVNAVKEQQTEIEAQQKQIEQQQKQINALKKFICAQNPGAEICKEQ